MREKTYYASKGILGSEKKLKFSAEVFEKGFN